MSSAGDAIVVGADGSQESKAALRWAIDEARSRGCDVLALYAAARAGGERAGSREVPAQGGT